MSPNLEKPFYSPKEIADLLGVHPSTVLNYIRGGQLYAIRLSERTIRIPNRALRRFLDEGRPRHSLVRDAAEFDMSEAELEPEQPELVTTP